MPLLRYTSVCLEAARHNWIADEPVSPAEAQTRRRISQQISIPLFHNRFIERVLARAHPVTPILWTGPLMVYGLYRGSRLGPLGAAGLFVAGIFAWTLLEYLMHRFLFHLAARSPRQLLRSFMVHGYHHAFPADKMRLVAPPLMAWPIAAAVGSLYVLLLGASAGLALLAGTLAGYVTYDWTHYYAHHFQPRTRVGTFIKRYHLMHHFDGEHPQARFGVSSPLWDLIFGTYVAPRRPKRPVRSTHRDRDALSAPSN